MRIRRGHHEHNFTVLPNAFLQDERLSWATRGLLAEVLSRPDGWTASADSLSERARRLRPDNGHGEGRRAVRAMFAEGKRYGYIIAEKERIGPGEDGAGRFRTVLAFYDTPQSDTGTGTSVPPAETEKCQVAPGTGTGTSETGTSIERTENKEPRSTKNPAVAEAPDKSETPSNPAAIAEVRAAAPTPKMGSSKPKQPKIPKQRQPWPSNEKRDNDWRAQIAVADVDELDGVADACRDGHGGSAYRRAAFRLGLGAGGNVPAELYPQYIRHMYLYLLKEVAATDPEHLDEFQYPLDPTIEAGPAPYKWDETMHVPAGETAASFSSRMLQIALHMAPEQLGPWVGEIEDFLPGLWYEKRHEARECIQAQGLPLEIETIASVAVRLLIEYYANKPVPKWPMEVVPPSMRPVGALAQAQSPPWAA